jgi:Pterin 4 alpha carbinolamine dehydratase
MRTDVFPTSVRAYLPRFGGATHVGTEVRAWTCPTAGRRLRGALQREFRFKDFSAAINFVDRLAEVAETAAITPTSRSTGTASSCAGGHTRRRRSPTVTRNWPRGRRGSLEADGRTRFRRAVGVPTHKCVRRGSSAAAVEGTGRLRRIGHRGDSCHRTLGSSSPSTTARHPPIAAVTITAFLNASYLPSSRSRNERARTRARSSREGRRCRAPRHARGRPPQP